VEMDGEKFDLFVEGLFRKFSASRIGRPSLVPGIYFRALLIGYFESINSERGIAWRLADLLALRQFVRISLTETTPDHSTISRTRRLIDLETHRAVFAWVLGLLADRGLIQGKRVGVDATSLEASAAMRSIVRRDTGESYEEFLSPPLEEHYAFLLSRGTPLSPQVGIQSPSPCRHPSPPHTHHIGSPSIPGSRPKIPEGTKTPARPSDF
jgi:transposase